MTTANRAVVWMDKSARVWLAALTVIALVLVVLGVSNAIYTANTAAKAAQQEAIREAAIQDAYKQCVQSIPLLTKFREHFAGVNELAGILVTNGRASIRAASKSDRLAVTRRANLRRVLHAARRIGAVQKFPVPSFRSCAARRDQTERETGG